MARVLIVDDDHAATRMINDIIKKYAETLYKSDWELTITSVGNAISALEIIQEHNYELIITDILMARMDGWEFIREIRKKFPQFSVPIVVISAIEGVELEYEAMRHGASAWFRKPISSKNFAKEVFKLIQER